MSVHKPSLAALFAALMLSACAGAPVQGQPFGTQGRGPRTVVADRGLLTPAAVERYISYFRATIDDWFDKRLLHTVRGVGYALRAD